ncbi:ABC transporter substrate-binding protein [Coleofasciculus sp. E1-EBD-02]|uniref:ABC transporter substrate-binding protein n=1 Tax=Coleofasciculus sp. E1-EBD-02 TaxID=3068481 RepID=UPI003300AD94
MGRAVYLTLDGDLDRGIRVILEWGEEGYSSEGRISGRLLANPEITQLYQHWQTNYRQLEEIYRRPRLEELPDYNTSREDCQQFADQLKEKINQWLNATSNEFYRIRENLAVQLNHYNDIRVLIQTDNPQLQQLPWHLWDFWERQGSVEIILSTFEYQAIRQKQLKNKIRLLAVFGKNDGINITFDKQVLQKTPGIESCLLPEPTREQLENRLHDEQGWDIFFFAGHSYTEGDGSTGRLYLNETESLTVDELRNALSTAIKKRLSLAIFNSCDGLGLAQVLADLKIPQVIVMREPVPDEVAHKFLTFFIEKFSQGASLQKAVNTARKRLESIEDRLPYATWLPVMYQHPTAASFTWTPPRNKWQRLGLRFGLGLAVVLSTLMSLDKLAIEPGRTCPANQGDFISCGEEILLQRLPPRLKERGVELLAESKYTEAIELLNKSWQKENRDPETLIYLNNALLQAKGAKFYTIAVAVPVIQRQNESTSVTDSELAQEILRGVAQLQTEVNLGLFEGKEKLVENFPGYKFLPKQAIKNQIGLRVVITDDSNDTEAAKQRAKALVKQQEILGVVGHYTSESTVAAIDVYQENKLVVISPGTTTEELTEEPKDVFFRTVHSNRVEAKYLADYLRNEAGQKQAVIFYNPNSPFTSSLRQEFETRFKEKGGTVVNVKEFNLSKKNFNVEKAITEVNQQAGETALVLLPDGQVTDSLFHAIDLVKVNNGDNWIVGSWSLYGPKSLAIADLKPFDKFVLFSPWLGLSSPNQEFIQDARDLWGGEVSARTALTYDAARAHKQALVMQDKPTRMGMQETLMAPDFSAEGATGTIKFEPNGNRWNPPGLLVQVAPCSNRHYGLAFVSIESPYCR